MNQLVAACLTQVRLIKNSSERAAGHNGLSPADWAVQGAGSETGCRLVLYFERVRSHAYPLEEIWRIFG
jgi:hypothetical protein